MARKPRIHCPGALYHVILRGNDRQAVFFDDPDRDLWESLLLRALERYEASLHAYCWMTNHMHFIAQVGEKPLGAVVRHAAARYSRRVNEQQNRTGHLFERRHRAILVTGDRYLMGLVRYIHRNPVRAGMVANLDEYRWSSHPIYAGLRSSPWLTTDTVLQMFGETSATARRNYRRFMQDHAQEDLSQYRKGRDEDHEAPITRKASGSRQDDPEGGQQQPTLESIIHRHLKTHGLAEAQLSGPGRARYLTSVRGDIAVEALEQGVTNIAGLARRLNRSESAISQAVNIRKKHCKK